ncbi:GPP34 family phosphoprotein [Streptomyces sp. RPA4-2]|uniref:GOLPH3/VPS74 family protein n=1 Tax=Streptomyces sp. RPA4-2 TaxID=2721244 RepID=UPI00143E9BE1|nr:GPP34 family phosphoprotein [Streptomyces sp. RPA4-2]QIY60409.1 GPP34 family phosphoprotein [Streptomyces sp. RPA4-2]
MTTPQDLLIVVLDTAAHRTVTPGDLSLALAGAELIDLLKAPTIRLDGGRIVPGHLPGPADPLLTQAAASFVMEEPYEPVSDWLWRRGDRLTNTYMTALEAQGVLARKKGRLLRDGQKVLTDSPARLRAGMRWSQAEPVLRALAVSLGISGEQTEEPSPITDYAVQTVLAAVTTALGELQAERQRRTIEQAAFDNLWRALE